MLQYILQGGYPLSNLEMKVGGGDSDDVDVVLVKCERDSSKFAEAWGGLSVDEPGEVQLAIGRDNDAARLCSYCIYQQVNLLQGHAGILESAISWYYWSL